MNSAPIKYLIHDLTKFIKFLNFKTYMIKELQIEHLVFLIYHLNELSKAAIFYSVNDKITKPPKFHRKTL